MDSEAGIQTVRDYLAANFPDSIIEVVHNTQRRALVFGLAASDGALVTSLTVPYALLAWSPETLIAHLAQRDAVRMLRRAAERGPAWVVVTEQDVRMTAAR